MTEIEERIQNLEKRINDVLVNPAQKYFSEADKAPGDYGKFCGRCQTHVYSNKPINVCSSCRAQI